MLAYKRKRNIVNPAYQTQPDNIVGKMTMASLDSELYEFDRNRNTCVLTRATPPDVLAPGTTRLLIGFAASPNGSVGGSDAVVMQKALQDSRRTVRAAIDTLTLVAGRLRLGNEIWTEQESKAVAAAVLWLRTDSPNTPEAKRRIAGIITSAVALLRRNLSVRTSKGGDPILQRAPIWPHAVSFGDPDLGILLISDEGAQIVRGALA